MASIAGDELVNLDRRELSDDRVDEAFAAFGEAQVEQYRSTTPPDVPIVDLLHAIERAE